MKSNLPARKSYQELTEALAKQLAPKLLAIAERFNLRQRNQTKVSSVEHKSVNLTQLTALPITNKELAKETKKDQLLSKASRYTMKG